MKKLTESELQEKARELVSKEVYCNVHGLVEFSLKASYEGNMDIPVSYEDFYSEQPDFYNLDDDELKDWLVKNVYSDTSELDDLDHYELVQECEDNYTEPEIYEYWAVSDWLGRKLKDHGEIVADVYPTIWGRTTTGQAILLDGVIRDIVKELHETYVEPFETA